MGHIISNIHIKNFKSIKNQEFELSNFTPLVGYNNAGKSNILEAIKWVLRKSSLSTSCFNDITQPITMIAKIEGITIDILDNIEQTHRARIEPFLQNEILTIKRIQETPGQGVAQIKLMVLDPNDGITWQNNPAGIDNAIKDLFPEPIHIGAMENSEEDISRSSTTSTIGKLLAEIIGPIELQYGEQVNAALGGLKQILDAEGIHRAPELVSFDQEINGKLDAFFPDITVKVHIPTPELKEVFRKGTIKVYENLLPNPKDVSSLGHGAQRSIQMTLIRHLANLKLLAQQNRTTTLLLIDEPELYLHPQAIEILRKSLNILSTQGYQVIFSTHSPFMITQKDVGNTVLVRKNSLLGTFKRTTLKSAVPTVEQIAQHQLTLMYSLSNSSNILFSEKVILVEGKTENKLLPLIIEKVSGRTILHHKTALVKLDGSSNIKKSMQVLSTMDLPTKSIADLDFALKNGISEGYLQVEDTDITACLTEIGNIALANNIFIGTDGWPAKSSNSISAAEGFTILAQSPIVTQNIENIFTKMQVQNIWIWKYGTIENHLNLTGKNEMVWANFTNTLEQTTLQNMLPNHFQEIENCINWLLN
ncbi:ATP-dependent nuclease [Flavobacterium frigidarium]|uniref:ATP-dependent nuclease n=1 Tax=Flavobacterium frigidarium TaxID=99286 RepID=UPI00047A4B90|nr:AAA family ATPase [Flavobacterium frigidarium]